MIAVEVSVDVERIEQVVAFEDDVEQWLLSNVGNRAPHRDSVDELRPWYVSRRWETNTYHFARETDATLFSLRWCQ